MKFSVKTDYDGLLRAVLTQSSDDINNIHRYQAQSFNPWNNPTYQSYPASSQSGTANSGSWSTYDGLQRLATQNVTGGGTTHHEYLSGNRLKVTNARNNDTITTFQAFGSPTFERPSLIISEVSSGKEVHTQMDINVFGDITQITQSDGGNTEKHIEYRAYDNLHNLCKITRGDTGITVFSVSHLGELVNKAEGVEQGSTGSHSNCHSNKGSSDTISFTQDNLGNLWKVDYPDASPDVTYTRDNNGNTTKLQAGANRTDYVFNSLNMVEKETLVVAGKTLMLDYGYNTLGAIDTIKYPNSDTMYFAPNNFGEPTKVGKIGHNYATNATWYPNGMIDTFNYGNGLTHKTTLNSRQLPQSVKDNKSGTTALHYSYTYDNNLNVNTLTDHVNNSYSLTNLVYDGLDRLTNVSGNTGIGSSTMTYDSLGNIKTYSSKGQNLTYTYNYTANTSQWGDNTTNRLRQVHDSVGQEDYLFFTYDDRGNITNTSFNNLTFNRANQLSAANGLNSYVYDGHGRRIKQTDSEGTSYSMYSLDGTLMYRENQYGGINYIYLGKKLIAKDGYIPENSGKQHYRPYGDSIEGATDDVGYTGHKFDKDLGLSYMQARYYDPVIGRFYSNDPVDSAIFLSQRNVQGFNRFAYANNNPYKYTDPDGKAAFLAALAPYVPPAIAAAKATLGIGAVVGADAAMEHSFDQINQMNESADGTSNGITIDDDGSGAVEITVETENGDITVIGEPSIDDDTLTLDGTHIDGPGAGKLGLKGVRDIGRKIGEAYRVGEVVINGGERNTGANKGKKPIPVRVKVDKEQ